MRIDLRQIDLGTGVRMDDVGVEIAVMIAVVAIVVAIVPFANLLRAEEAHEDHQSRRGN